MAMIKCSECGQNISDKAAVCIGCGAPIATTLQVLEAERTKIAEKDTNEKLTAQRRGLATKAKNNMQQNNLINTNAIIDDNISLKQLINEDINNAWRTEDEASLGVLKMLRAAIEQHEMDKHNELSDAYVANIIEIMIKEQCSSIPKFEDIGRQDLADTERFRMNLLNTYLQPNHRKSGLAPASSNKCIATDVPRKEFKMNKDAMVAIAVAAVVVIGYFGYDYYQGKQLAYPNGYPGGNAQWQQDMRDQMNGVRK